MQNINLKDDLTNSTEVKVFCTDTECQITKEELTTLRQQVTDLNRTIESLENTIQIKGTQLQHLHRGNERLSTELKKQQRCNRNIKQQLNDERFFYQREKDYFNEEIQRQKARCLNNASKLQQQQRKELEQARDSLEEENKSLREELKEKSETTYNLCIKFLRMKHAKDALRHKLDQLLAEHLQVMADMMEKLDEARRELNIIVSDKFQEPLPLSKAKFLQVVQRNARLVHENATLKVQIQHLTLNIERLKSYVQKPKLINVDAKIITKLAEQSGRRHRKESSKWPPLQSNANESEKIVPLARPHNYQDPVDHSGDAKLTSKLQPNDSKKYAATEVQGIQTEEALRAERARSAPEMAQARILRGCSTIELTDYSLEFCDASTNT